MMQLVVIALLATSTVLITHVAGQETSVLESECESAGGFYCGDDESNWSMYAPYGCVPANYICDAWDDCMDAADESDELCLNAQTSSSTSTTSSSSTSTSTSTTEVVADTAGISSEGLSLSQSARLISDEELDEGSDIGDVDFRVETTDETGFLYDSSGTEPSMGGQYVYFTQSNGFDGGLTMRGLTYTDSNMQTVTFDSEGSTAEIADQIRIYSPEGSTVQIDKSTGQFFVGDGTMRRKPSLVSTDRRALKSSSATRSLTRRLKASLKA